MWHPEHWAWIFRRLAVLSPFPAAIALAASPAASAKPRASGLCLELQYPATWSNVAASLVAAAAAAALFGALRITPIEGNMYRIHSCYWRSSWALSGRASTSDSQTNILALHGGSSILRRRRVVVT